jgi:hypothetical protein
LRYCSELPAAAAAAAAAVAAAAAAAANTSRGARRAVGRGPARTVQPPAVPHAA